MQRQANYHQSNSVEDSQIVSGIESLFSNSSGDFDIGEVVSKFSQADGLQDIVGSWLGDGDNVAIEPETVASLFKNEQVSNFADRLNIDQDEATNLLAEVVPDIIDNISSGGSILDSIGGLGGAFNLAKKFF